MLGAPFATSPFFAREASLAKEERRTLEILSQRGTGKSPSRNKNKKVHRVITTQRNFVFRFYFRKFPVFSEATIRTPARASPSATHFARGIRCVRPAVSTHPYARRFSIALPRRRVRDNARGCLRTLRIRLAPNLPFESFRFLQHIYQGGDRPPGSQPSGMSMSKFRSCPQNIVNYTKSPRL